MTKILFIEVPEDYGGVRLSPHYDAPSMWPLTLATYLEKMASNIESQIINGRHLTIETIKRKIAIQKPDFIGLSPVSITYLNTLALCRFAKKLGARVILGGIQATNLRKEILKNRGRYSADYCVDVVVQGDGERALL